MEEAAQGDELAEVVGVVVGEEHGLAGESLAGAAGDGGEEVGGGVGDEGAEGLEVAAEGGKGGVPSVVVGGGGGGGPVAVGEGGGDVGAIDREAEDVPLADADVLEELPEVVLQGGDEGGAEGGGDVGEGVVEGEVGGAAVEELEEVLAEEVVARGWRHGGPPWFREVYGPGTRLLAGGGRA